MVPPRLLALPIALTLSACSPSPPPPAAAPSPPDPPAPAAQATTPAAPAAAPAPASGSVAQPEATGAERASERASGGSTQAETGAARPVKITDNPEAARQQITAGIRALGGGRYEVSEEAWGLLLANGGRDATGGHARLVPESRGGQPQGLRVFGVRPGDPFAALGLENGDVVRSVAGKPLSSPEKALEAYASLAGAKAVAVEIERQGKPMTLSYQIVPR